MTAQEVDGVRYIPDKESIVAEAYGEQKRIFLDEHPIDYCVGVYGDGCGGGRLFVLYGSYVKVYDLDQETDSVLFEGFAQAQGISKSGCQLSVQTPLKRITYNLSTMKEEKE